MINIKKLVEVEIKLRDEKCEKLYELYLDNKLGFTEYSTLRNKYFIEIELLRELKDKYEVD